MKVLKWVVFFICGVIMTNFMFKFSSINIGEFLMCSLYGVVYVKVLDELKKSS